MANYKEVNGICTPMVDFSIPVPGTRDAADANIVDGIDIRDGQKGTKGIMAEVGGVTLEGDAAPGVGLPTIPGSAPRANKNPSTSGI